MKLPRFISNIVRAGASPEIVTTRNFDDLTSVLEDAFGMIEANDKALTDLIATKAKGKNPNFLGTISTQVVLSRQGLLQPFSISENLSIPAGWYTQMISPVVETGITVTIEAGGLWFIDA